MKGPSVCDRSSPGGHAALSLSLKLFPVQVKTTCLYLYNLTWKQAVGAEVLWKWREWKRDL